MTEAPWVQFSAHSFKRKRAELACVLCHSKKIRCDLQSKRNDGQESCTNCASAGKDCRTRPSRRNKTRRIDENPQSHPPTPPTDNTENSRGLLLFESNAFQNGIPFNCQVSDTRENELSPTDRQERGSFEEEPHSETTIPVLTTSPSQRYNNHQPIMQNTAAESWIASTRPPEIRAFSPDIFQEPRSGKTTNTPEQLHSFQNSVGVSHADLRQSYIETYFEYCYAWCPVLDRTTILDELIKSPLLDDALAIGGSHLRSPLVPHPGPAAYYDRARRKFYEDEEEDLVKSLKGVLLFYWWAPRPPLMVHKHSSWWWTAVVIKHAQQAGFHHQPVVDSLKTNDINRCFKRRIWWTAFARERLSAICQGKPCLIDPEDCNLPEPSLEDFPDVGSKDKDKAEVFIYWVRLCAIIGRISKELSRSTNSFLTASPFPVHLGRELIKWVRSLPSHLQLPIRSAHTSNFQLDVHQLHLPYLAVIVLLHLARSSQSMPRALPPAIMAATYILLRNATRYVMPITCWYTAMSFICLLQVSRTEHLRSAAQAEIDILISNIKELQKMWATATVVGQQFDRLLARNKPLTPEDFPNSHLGNNRSTRALHSEEDVLQSGIDWLDYFPFVTSQTSSVAEQLLAPQNAEEFLWDDASMFLCQDFLQGMDDWAGPDIFV
ncbi:hypothetical protein BGW36DRAFT_418249 [Talaromyces proteolyticus]|uniref:Zn(2)-C6 fungal-type domain-containing protein n=1 Tax=Talaromyces proteolyticus TaxID=1131652 RepID=A0AAD4PZC8_9EURO|nr:uncharacterized protein BGW36DRAFT_418249 [Talaromyces proteolyticus]KAH8695549.1 hypothetical protein BGW36DRAFT_418249 [Talaromyces proteolyticus]